MPKLIVIEGLDGSGKATQAKLLTDFFTANLDALHRENNTIRNIRLVSFPDYDSPSSSLIKLYLAGEFGSRPDDVNAYAASSFFAVDRYASYKRDWAKDYENGVIIADRYTTSNAIHQCSKLDEKDWDEYLNWLFDFEYKLLGIPAPDKVIFLRVDSEVSQQLMTKRYEGDERKKDIHERNRGYLERCQNAADYCCKKLGWQIIECCNNGQMRSAEEIHADIRKKVCGLLDYKEIGRREAL